MIKYNTICKTSNWPTIKFHLVQNCLEAKDQSQYDLFASSEKKNNYCNIELTFMFIMMNSYEDLEVISAKNNLEIILF